MFMLEQNQIGYLPYNFLNEQNQIALIKNKLKLCIGDCKGKQISLSQIYEGKENILHNIATFSNLNNIVFIFFGETTLFELPLKLNAFVLDKGELLGIVERGKVLESNFINVFETSAGRLAILICEDVFENNIFYYLKALDVDFVVIYGKNEEIQYLSSLNIEMQYIVFDGNKILNNKM